MTRPTSFTVHAIPAALLERVRSSETDASGNRIELVQAEGGEPLRCCLCNALPGESLILFGYEPPIGDSSPYREVGPVFAHSDACEGPPPGDVYPPAWRGKKQVLRAYDERGWIHDAIVHDGSDPEAEIARFFEDPKVVQLHSRNVAYGCFMFQVTRSA